MYPMSVTLLHSEWCQAIFLWRLRFLSLLREAMPEAHPLPSMSTACLSRMEAGTKQQIVFSQFVVMLSWYFGYGNPLFVAHLSLKMEAILSQFSYKIFQRKNDKVREIQGLSLIYFWIIEIKIEIEILYKIWHILNIALWIHKQLQR